MNPDAELIALRRQVRELTEELAEYRRGPTREARRHGRVAEARTVLGGRDIAPGAVRAILHLSDHAGVAVTCDGLLAAIAIKAPEEVESKLLEVTVSKARRALRARGLPSAIETVRGVGYSMTREQAAAVRALIGEGA